MNADLFTSGPVLGIGTDIVECNRIDKTLQRQGEAFLKKVYTEAEAVYAMSMKNPIPPLAARFAAKEAVAKAFTTGIGEHLDWKSISVVKGERDEPHIELDEKGQKLLESIGGKKVLISLSHTSAHGLAFAVIVGQD